MRLWLLTCNGSGGKQSVPTAAIIWENTLIQTTTNLSESIWCDYDKWRPKDSINLDTLSKLYITQAKDNFLFHAIYNWLITF